MPLRLRDGLRLLEIGCGMGFHSHLFFKLGFEVTGIDCSAAGISYAKRHFHGPRFLRLNADSLSAESGIGGFDIIFARNMSWYHYELGGMNRFGVDVPGRTKMIFSLLAQHGIFILQIATDFSGRHRGNGCHNNERRDYINLFNPLGKIIFISNHEGRILKSEKDAKKFKKNIIIATQKL